MSMLSRWTIESDSVKGGELPRPYLRNERADDDRRIIGKQIDPLANDKDLRVSLNQPSHLGREDSLINSESRGCPHSSASRTPAVLTNSWAGSRKWSSMRDWSARSPISATAGNKENCPGASCSA